MNTTSTKTAKRMGLLCLSLLIVGFVLALPTVAANNDKTTTIVANGTYTLGEDTSIAAVNVPASTSTSTVTATIVSTTTSIRPTTTTVTSTITSPTTITATDTTTATTTVVQTNTETDVTTTTQYETTTLPPVTSTVTSTSTSISTTIIPTTITNTQTNTETQTSTTTATQTVLQPYGRFQAVIVLPTAFTTPTTIDSNVNASYNGVEYLVPNISTTQTFAGYTSFVVNDNYVPLGASQVSVTFNGLTIIFNFPTSPTNPNAPNPTFTATFPSETITGFYTETYP